MQQHLHVGRRIDSEAQGDCARAHGMLYCTGRAHEHGG